jgi:hypothetical protein
MPANAGIQYFRGDSAKYRRCGVLDHPHSRMVTLGELVMIHLADALRDHPPLFD